MSPGFSTASGAAEGKGKWPNVKCHNTYTISLGRYMSHASFLLQTGQWSLPIKVELNSNILLPTFLNFGRSHNSNL